MTADVTPRQRCHDRRASRRLALLLTCAVAAFVGDAGPALAAPGLTPLGHDSQIGLPTGQQGVSAVAVHRGAVYVAVFTHGDGRDQWRVERYDPTRVAWLPVAGPLNNVGSTSVTRVALLATRGGELYVAWTEHAHDGSWRAVVARLTPDGGGWERIMQTPAYSHARVRLAQVGEQAWVAWDGRDGGVRLARITAGHVDASPTDMLPAGAWLEDLVGYGAVAYIMYTEYVQAPAYRDPVTGEQIPADSFDRLRVVRLAPVAGRGVQLTEIGRWNDAGTAFLTAGTPDAPARPIVAWNSPQGIEVMRLRTDGNGFDRIPVAPLITLRRIQHLRGLAATPAGITIAATSGRYANVRVYTLTGDSSRPDITEGDPLPRAALGQDVMLVPARIDADPGALILGYNRASPWRAAAMRYSP